MMTPSKLIRLLTKKGWKIASAESCTGGLFAKTVTDTPGASAVFEYGAVTYSNAVKNRLLSVDEGTLNTHGAVSAETAKEMAKNVCLLADADIGISTTGLAGPDGDGVHEVGTVFIGIYRKIDGLSTAEKCLFKGSRDDVREAAVKAAYALLEPLLKSE